MRHLMRLHRASADPGAARSGGVTQVRRLRSGPGRRRVPRTLGATAALAVLALLGAGLSAPATAGAADDGLNPGGVTRFPERVRVNVVFVGFDEGDAPWRAVRSELPSSAEPIVRSRAFYGISEPLGLRYSYDFQPHYTSQAWRTVLPLPLLDRSGEADHRPPAGVQPAVRPPRRHREPLDRRTLGREAADRLGTHRSTRGSPRSSSSTGTAAATSSSTSTPRPGSRTPTPATTSAPTTAASSLPGVARPRRRGDGARPGARCQPGLVLRPVGRP